MKRIARLFLTLLLASLAPVASATPAASFRTAAGEPVSLGAFRGRPVLVDVWASWCAPCLPGLVEVQRIADRYGPRGLAIVPLSTDRGGAPAALRSYARLDLARLPLYLGNSASFDARILPTAILFDAAGREVARFEGKAWRAAAIATAIEKLLPPTKRKPS